MLSGHTPTHQLTDRASRENTHSSPIRRQRGTTGGGTGVNDSIVNQLLSKIDGVDSLNNILLIGMTNRKDMIDEAVLRPGRLELHVEIGLPDTPGRHQILSIHTAELKVREGGEERGPRSRVIADAVCRWSKFCNPHTHACPTQRACFAGQQHARRGRGHPGYGGENEELHGR